MIEGVNRFLLDLFNREVAIYSYSFLRDLFKICHSNARDGTEHVFAQTIVDLPVELVQQQVFAFPEWAKFRRTHQNCLSKDDKNHRTLFFGPNYGVRLSGFEFGSYR